ncbi:MAG: hypothetical protein HYX50_01290 [Chloroflexi bacterium]|nr:hypothetical protein [Chloroflexota bacterium]
MDDDLIEATIRRVAEEKAAREALAESVASAPPADGGAPAAGEAGDGSPDDGRTSETVGRVQAVTSQRSGDAEPEGQNDITEQTRTDARAADDARIAETLQRVRAASAASQAAGAAFAATGDEADADTSAARASAIEATIRRVQQASASSHGEATTPAMPTTGVDAARESAIEATIRRVQAASGAATAPVAGADGAGETDAGADESAIEATIRRVQAASAAGTAPVAGAGGAGETAAATTDARSGDAETDAARESAIEATIRRVAAAKAAREADASAPETPQLDAEGKPMTRLQAATAAWQGLRESPSAMTMPVRKGAPTGISPTGESDVVKLRERVASLERAVLGLTARLDAVERAARASQAVEASAVASQRQGQDEDEEWDEAPIMPRIPTGPPRPAIFREPVTPPRSAAATAEPLYEAEPERYEEEEAPAPVAAQAEPRRGLDLLPRTYRITVEDRRRGVDLVPLHRALLGLDCVRDMSLMSYANGVAIVSLEVVHELEPDALGNAVSRAMSREARVEVHNDTTMVVKLAED